MLLTITVAFYQLSSIPGSNGPCSRVTVDIREDIRGFPWISIMISMLARIIRQGYPWYHGQGATDIHK